ncbi:hypothetical protein TNCV_3072931 [Trichonephila clavipes]|nr:hypothetical protein TNCV_3072931 [Trichonephila clavipes]
MRAQASSSSLDCGSELYEEKCWHICSAPLSANVSLIPQRRTLARFPQQGPSYGSIVCKVKPFALGRGCNKRRFGSFGSICLLIEIILLRCQLYISLANRMLLVTDFEILNFSQVVRAIPELAPPYSPNLPHHTNVRILNLDRSDTHQPLYTLCLQRRQDSIP